MDQEQAIIRLCIKEPAENGQAYLISPGTRDSSVTLGGVWTVSGYGAHSYCSGNKGEWGQISDLILFNIRSH